MRLFFIRHGQTDWNLRGKIQGSCDIELNNTGILQAEELSRKVIEKEYKFTKVYTSRQKRAMKTAEILSKAIDVDCVPIEGIEEMNLGEWEGLSWLEVQEKFPTEYEIWFNNRRYTPTPKGEAYQDILKRVLATIGIIVNENSGDVAIVTHSAVIMCLQCYITNTPFNEMMKFSMDNSAIIEMDSNFLVAI